MALTCPDCGLEQAVWLPDCPRCGVEGVSWRDASEPAPERERKTLPLHQPTFHVAERAGLARPGWLLATLVLAASTLVAVVLGGGQGEEASAAAVAAEPVVGAVLVTYRNGDKCLVHDWGFRYLRTYRRHEEKNGVVVADLVDRHEAVEDDVLRYYGPLGEHRAVQASELGTIHLVVGARSDGQDGFAVDETRIVTERFTDDLLPTEIPASYRFRLLVPDAPHFWPESYEDQPERWRGVSVHLVGRFSDVCPGPEHIDLTSDRHALPWTPIRLEFHAR